MLFSSSRGVSARTGNRPPHGIAGGNADPRVESLADVGLLKRGRRGNQLIYSANRHSTIFSELAGILRKTSGLADVVAEALEPLSGRIDVAAIFGSVARGTETEGSDVDVLIIGSVDFGTIIDALYPAQLHLQREINPKVFGAVEWKSKLKAKNSFVLDALANAKILGDENELAEPSRRNPGADHPGQGNN